MPGRIDRERAAKLLSELPYLKNALLYYDSLAEAPLSREEARFVRVKRRQLMRSVAAGERALALLTPTERQVAEILFLRPRKEGEDICALCAMEKSTVYRWRKRVLDKIFLAVWGGECSGAPCNSGGDMVK